MATKVMVHCDTCGGETEHWDNRIGKRNPKAPDFKCTVCGSGVWQQGGQQSRPAPRQQTRPAPRPVQAKQEAVKKEMLVSYEKDLMVASVNIVVAEMASGINPPSTEDRVLAVFETLKNEFRAKVLKVYFKPNKPTPPPPPPPEPMPEYAHDEYAESMGMDDEEIPF